MYFIMIYSQNGKGAFPIVDDNENVVFCDSLEEARRIAATNSVAHIFGHEVFQLGTGE